jgi:serine/threonine protein kinase
LAELFTGYVLFQNDSVQGLLSRVIGIIGPVPEFMMKEGRLGSNFFTREGLIYQEANEGEDTSDAKKGRDKHSQSEEDMKIHILVAKKTTLKKRLKCDDQHFVDFVRWLLEVDPLKRPTAKEALTHPWLTECQYEME